MINLAKSDNVTLCPVCKGPVKIVRRSNGDADHYAPADYSEIAGVLLPQNPVTAAQLRKDRKGKSTVALVGMSPTSCSLAPFDDKDVEIWGLNEMHAFPWMKRADRWFQIHSSASVQREVQKRNIRGHYDWLKKNEWNIPVYMSHLDENIPLCTVYPLKEVCNRFLYGFTRGENQVKYFTSTFAYYMGLALLEEFDRIEIYGFEFADDLEYVRQKACAEFWIGIALGKGIEIYTPPECNILHSELYGGNEQGEGW